MRLLVVVCLVVAAPASADWPMANGPGGNFLPAKSGAKLIDDLNNAMRVWISEGRDIGYAKGSASGYVKNLATWPGHPGSCSGPIVAGDLVLVSSFRPSGDVWAANLPHLKNKRNRDLLSDKLRDNLRIDADDLLVAIDRNTGKTAWKAIEKSKGINLYMGKREGFGVAPAAHNGMVFSMGTTGRLYAYDLKTGTKRWERNIGAAHQEMEAEKRRALAAKTFPKKTGWNASLVVAGGVLVVPLYDHGVDISLRGVDPQTGKTRWELSAITSRYATPAVFHHAKRQYLLCATRKGELRLIEPIAGKILWTVSGLQPTWFALSPSQNHVLVNVGSKSEQRGKRDQPMGLLGCYQLSPTGARRIWTMPDKKEFWFENHMDSCARRKVAIADGKVCFFAANKVGGVRNRWFSILDEKTGKVLLSTDKVNGYPQFYPVEDRLLWVPDPSHGHRLTMELYSADPKNFRKFGSQWKPPQTSTTAYEVYMEIPCVDGRIYLRTRDGDVRCYDLRK